VPPALSFGGYSRVKILLDVAWLLLMFVEVSPQTSVPPLMSPLSSRSRLVLGFCEGLIPEPELDCFDLPVFHA